MLMRTPDLASIKMRDLAMSNTNTAPLEKPQDKAAPIPYVLLDSMKPFSWSIMHLRSLLGGKDLLPPVSKRSLLWYGLQDITLTIIFY
jgi:hypothetical protein